MLTIKKKGGSLCFYGDWFGRPGDNYHRIVRAACEAAVLTIRFDGGEIAKVYEPRGIVNSEDEFYIHEAAKVEWIHHWYDASKEQLNDRTDSYVRAGDGVEKTSKYGVRTLALKKPYHALYLL